MNITARNSEYGVTKEKNHISRSNFISFIFGLLFLHVLIMASEAKRQKVESKKKVICFGGNGFIGAATVRQLLATAKFDITTVSRGNWEWDTDVTVKPNVRHIKCDRYREESIGYVCPELVKYVDSVDEIYAVIDFSAYERKVIIDAMKLLTRKPVGVYIYISSDSVYEVCNKTHDAPTVEEDAVRPESEYVRKILNEKDSYGHKKLEGEETLKTVFENNGPPFITLRLPDVIGPRDATDRFWMYQLWIKLSGYTREPVRLPRSLEDAPLSFVFVNDVARCITEILISKDKTTYRNAYNLAFDETVTLEELLLMIKNELGAHDATFVHDEEINKEYYLFPSVTKGPISTEKAKDKLHFKSTSLAVAVKQTVNFYEKAMKNSKFRKEIKDVVKELKRDLFGSNELFAAAFDELYDYNIHAMKQNEKSETSHDEL